MRRRVVGWWSAGGVRGEGLPVEGGDGEAVVGLDVDGPAGEVEGVVVVGAGGAEVGEVALAVLAEGGEVVDLAAAERDVAAGEDAGGVQGS
jgi:hypothetical protein